MTGKPNRYAIVGMKHRGAEELVASLPPDEPLTLVREPNNQWDPNAVKIYARGQHIGYIPKTQNAVLARFIDVNGGPAPEASGALGVAMDANLPKSISARLHKGSNSWPLVEII